MSLGQRVTGFEPRSCPKCGAVQESLGSTVCEQCGTDLSVARLEKSWPPQPAAQLSQRLRSPARVLAALPALLLRRGGGAVRSLVLGIFRFAFLFLRRAALLLVLAGIFVGLSYVPAVRARVPVTKEVTATVKMWVQRGEDLVAGLLAKIRKQAQPKRPAPKATTRKPSTTQKPAATQKPASTQRPAAAQPASAKPAVTVRSTPSGATVMLNARRVGTTPLTLTLAPGTYKLTISRAGYLSTTRTLVVKAGKPLAMEVELDIAR